MAPRTARSTVAVLGAALALAGCAPAHEPPPESTTVAVAHALSVPIGSRAADGQVVTRRGPSGAGELTVVNSTDTDALVTLASNFVAFRAVYVRAGGTARVGDVADGRYELFVTQGNGWDYRLERFIFPTEYRRYVEPVDFTPGVRFDLTLRSVPGGGADRSTPVDAHTYPR